MTVGDILAANSYQVRLCSFSALDNYLGLPSLPFVFAETDADVTALARMFEDIRFPGTDLADASAMDANGRTWYFRCRDADEARMNRSYVSYDLLSLVQEIPSRRYFDEKGIYPQIRALRKPTDRQPDAPCFSWWNEINIEACTEPEAAYRAAADGALILARYEAAAVPPPFFGANLFASAGSGRGGIYLPGPEARRLLLTGLMVSAMPDRGLEFLQRAGLLEKLWPELAALDAVDQSKEFHPEGNVWKHTLEALRHRKEGDCDLRLSLGLLLHDIGKPMAASAGGRRFDGHAELGAAVARRFLERLEFDPAVVSDVYFLIKNHMLPAALSRLPLIKTGSLMDSPLFPLLMELYRCDESSSFKGLESYYENAAFYRTYLRNNRNPYRSANGMIPRKRQRKKF